MDLGLSGKRALITGAGTGIGQSIALALAAEGVLISALDINEAALAELVATVPEGAVQTVKADLSSSAGCSTAVTEGLAQLGGLDILINNVGSGAVREFDDITDADWDATMGLNFMSYVRVTRQCLPILRQSPGASIVNNASDLAKQPEALPIDYAASKAAVLALTKGLARKEGPHIRVNAVAPGPIWTPFWTKPGGFADTLSVVHGMPPEQAVEHEMSLRQLPLGRLGTAEEVAKAVVFLASPASSFTTGSVWSVDGGSTRSLF